MLDGNSLTTWWRKEWLVKECRKTQSFTELKYLFGAMLSKRCKYVFNKTIQVKPLKVKYINIEYWNRSTDIKEINVNIVQMFQISISHASLFCIKIYLLHCL